MKGAKGSVTASGSRRRRTVNLLKLFYLFISFTTDFTESLLYEICLSNMTDGLNTLTFQDPIYHRMVFLSTFSQVG